MNTEKTQDKWQTYTQLKSMGNEVKYKGEQLYSTTYSQRDY